MAHFGLTAFGPQNYLTHYLRDQGQFTATAKPMPRPEKKYNLTGSRFGERDADYGVAPASYRTLPSETRSQKDLDDFRKDLPKYGERATQVDWLHPPYVSQVQYPYSQEIDSARGTNTAIWGAGQGDTVEQRGVAGTGFSYSVIPEPQEIAHKPAAEFKSNKAYVNHIHQHRRLKFNPQEKYREPVTSSMELGWYSQAPWEVNVRRGKQHCEETMYASEMVKAGIYF